MKKKIIIILLSIMGIFLLTGITYSALSSGTSSTINQSIAKFVFDAKKTDTIELPLYDLKPGDVKDYKFQVSNNKEEQNTNIISDVNIIYNVIISTYHFIPLNIELFKEENSNEVLIMSCDETYSRNDNNELVCKSSNQQISYNENKNDNYILRITFDEQYNTAEYSNIIDFIDLSIESYQKVGE